MTVREILTIPHPDLRKRCAHVEHVDNAMRTLLDDMLETMYDAEGIGLAANQIGVMKRAVVIHIKEDNQERDENKTIKHQIEKNNAREYMSFTPTPLYIVNPEITWRSTEYRSGTEGCLSIPDIREEVVRSDRIGITFLDRDGHMREMHCAGILAICLQHEIDHLNGVLFIDYLSRLKRDRIWSRAHKEQRRARPLNGEENM